MGQPTPSSPTGGARPSDAAGRRREHPREPGTEHEPGWGGPGHPTSGAAPSEAAGLGGRHEPGWGGPGHPTRGAGPSEAAGRGGQHEPGRREPGQREPGSLLDRLARTPVQPLAVGRSVRLATPAQRQALRVRDGGCAIPDCSIDAAYTQPHHVIGWALGGTTDLDSMVSLCWVHHRMTELGRFQFIDRKPGQPQPEGSLEHPRWWIIPPAPALNPAALT